MANEIVTQHNDLIELPLRNFNASELDILMAICYKCQNKGSNEIELKLSDIKSLAHYKNKNERQFVEAVKSTNRKILNLNFTVGDDRKFVQFALFPRFAVDLDEGTLSVRVADEFAYLLNDVKRNYTRLELQQSATLKSSYAKGMYKMLRRYRDWGNWKVSIEDFREYLDIPNSYKTGHINEKIIKPSIEELKPYFVNLKCKPYYDDHSKRRGRPKLLGYEFTFKKQPHKEPKQIEPTQEGIAKVTGWRKTQFYCPDCHQPIFCKEFENENGLYTMYAHTDFKTGKCKYKTYDTADLLRIEHIQDIKVKEEPVTEDQIANKSRLADMLSKMFSRRE